MFAKMFWKREKKVANGEKIPDHKTEIEALSRKIGTFEARLLDIEMSYDILRDKVLRKLQMKRQQDQEEEGNKPNLDGLPRIKI